MLRHYGLFQFLLIGVGCALLLASVSFAQEDSAPISSFDYSVPHVSTVPALAGQSVKLHVRERVAASGEGDGSRPVVLFVHGTPGSSVPAFDNPFKDYSWLAALGAAGFDAFAMDITGFGQSTRPPQLDDPCNASPDQQKLLMPSPLQAMCTPSYPYRLLTSQSEWDDMDAVVEYLMTLRGVEKVSLVGWSDGGQRTGGYAALHPEKVDRLVLLAPSYDRQTPTDPPAELPVPGFPLFVSSYLGGGQVSPAEQACGNSVEPGAADAVRAANRLIDLVGAGWGAGTTRAPLTTKWGWNASMAVQVQAPTLLMSGELDTTVLPQSVRDLYQDLGAEQKVFLELACTSHTAQSQSHYKIVQDASIDWLLHGSLDGQTIGSMRKGD